MRRSSSAESRLEIEDDLRERVLRLGGGKEGGGISVESSEDCEFKLSAICEPGQKTLVKYKNNVWREPGFLPNSDLPPIRPRSFGKGRLDVGINFCWSSTQYGWKHVAI